MGTSSYILNRLLPKGKNGQLIEILKDKLGGKIMRLATCSSLTDNNDKDNLIN